MRHQAKALCGASVIALSLAGSALAQTAPATLARQQGGTTVTEIVVTAQKHQENINNVGMSIQAATGEQLTRLGVTDTASLTKIVPGFNYTPSAYGTPIYTIRGVGFQDTSLAASPTVSLYLDEAPLPFSILSSGVTLDLQRVEVLKGPQGTLFGENATGGAINYIANKPTDHFEAGADISYGRFNTIDAQGFVSGPLTDTLSGRLAVRTLQSGPWQQSYTRNDQLGSQNFNTFRGSLLWKPTPKFRALFTVNGFLDESETQAAQLYGIETLHPPSTPLFPGLVNYPLAPHNDQAADWGPCVNTGSILQNQPPLSPTAFVTTRVAHPAEQCSGYRKHNSYYSASLRLDYDITDRLTFTSLSSYQHFDRNQPIDGDGMTYMDYESLQRGHISAAYQEFRLTGRFGHGGTWIVGANYENDATWDNFLQTYPDSSSGTIFGLYLGPTRPINRQIVNTYATYGNVEFPVTDTLTIQGGVRYTDQIRHAYQCGTDGGDGSWALSSQLIQNLLLTGNPFSGPGINVGPGNCATLNANPPYTPGLTYGKLDQDNVAWRGSINWKAIPGTLLYVNVSKGYKAGSYPTAATAKSNQLAPAVQESLLAYEGGFKSALFNHSLQLNGAFFYYDYKNKQILGGVLDPVFGDLPALVNVPMSHVIGFELNGTWVPFRGLTISPGVSLAHSRIDSCPADIVVGMAGAMPCAAVPGAVGVTQGGQPIPGGHYHTFNYAGLLQDYNGAPFPLAPEWQGDIDVQYEWPLRGDMKAYVGGNLNYQGSTTSGFGFSAFDIPSYALLDLRAGVERGPWSFQLWGRNVTNKWYWTGAYHVNDVFVRYTGMPATFGATFSYRFQ